MRKNNPSNFKFRKFDLVSIPSANKCSLGLSFPSAVSLKQGRCTKYNNYPKYYEIYLGFFPRLKLLTHDAYPQTK